MSHLTDTSSSTTKRLSKKLPLPLVVLKRFGSVAAARNMQLSVIARRPQKMSL
jgi:hypothetical protein